MRRNQEDETPNRPAYQRGADGGPKWKPPQSQQDDGPSQVKSVEWKVYLGIALVIIGFILFIEIRDELRALSAINFLEGFFIDVFGGTTIEEARNSLEVMRAVAVAVIILGFGLILWGSTKVKIKS